MQPFSEKEAKGPLLSCCLIVLTSLTHTVAEMKAKGAAVDEQLAKLERLVDAEKEEVCLCASVFTQRAVCCRSANRRSLRLRWTKLWLTSMRCVV